MQKIQLWSVERAEGKLSATAVESVDNTETEQDLEDLLVASPDLLMEGLTLIGRQVATAGGPLDLLGIDADGRPAAVALPPPPPPRGRTRAKGRASTRA